MSKRKYTTKIVVDAVQFKPQEPWPKEVIAWTDMVPRDGSWGYINISSPKVGRFHVCANDWIVYFDGGLTVVPNEHFKVLYDEVK